MNTSDFSISLNLDFGCHLPDKRLASRGLKLLGAILQASSAIVHQISQGRAEFMGYLRFLNNDRFDFAALIEAVVEHSINHIDSSHVLALQDTTEINYGSHENLLGPNELGPVGNNVDPGFFLHPTLLVDAHYQLPIGFGDIQCWTRAHDKLDKRQRRIEQLRIEEKESFKWIKSAQNTKKKLPEGTQITFIADREADIYDLFARVPDQRTHLIVRCMHNRTLKDQSALKLYELIGSLPVRGQYSFMVKNRWKDKIKLHSKHEALMELRFTPIRLDRARYHLDQGLSKFVDLFVVEAKENPLSVPSGEQPIHWRLLTTHQVDDQASARQIVEWYRQRWHIEQLFRILKKQGLQIEQARLHKGKALIKLAIMALLPSVKIMQLSLASKAKENPPAKIVFNSREIMYLWLVKEKFEGKTIKQQNQYEPESLAWAAWTIARLGGWKGYEKSSRAGPITIKRGLEKFKIMMQAWTILEKD